MSIADNYKHGPVLSYEVFPPRPTSPVESIFSTLDTLKEIKPAFVSVTYGAGGGKNSLRTFEIANEVHKRGIEGVVHLPGFSLSKDDVLSDLKRLETIGVSTVLALRGDIPQDNTKVGDFEHASDLIEFIKTHSNLNVVAACYPEGHPESKNRVQDTFNLKKKVDSGADALISQLFFDNDSFYNFKERCELVGIDVPIEAGIMPVTNKKQIERITSLCGVEIPKKFLKIMQRYEHDPIAMRDSGIAYAVDQIVDLITQGVDGIHLYTMNNSYIATKIYEAVKNLIHSNQLVA